MPTIFLCQSNCELKGASLCEKQCILGIIYGMLRSKGASHEVAWDVTVDVIKETCRKKDIRNPVGYAKWLAIRRFFSRLRKEKQRQLYIDEEKVINEILGTDLNTTLNERERAEIISRVLYAVKEKHFTPVDQAIIDLYRSTSGYKLAEARALFVKKFPDIKKIPNEKMFSTRNKAIKETLRKVFREWLE
ncbi:MAG: sigma-70 family RNA polymerase sigma factor [Verrucomicrobiae bacterium]|nr:sigma-70 family RNA polymerase sigma factor [Verrucomicrobiae bacterium]